nr:molybdopterin-dependent oxidoreductase [Diaphorobacter aerolatus]
MGTQPARTWLAQATRIGAARQRGAKVVVVDPKQDGSGQQADLWMPVRPGADAALALGAIRHLLETGSFDHEFAQHWTNAPLLVDRDSQRLLRAEELFDSASPGEFLVFDADGQLVVRKPAGAMQEGAWQLFAEGEFTDNAGQRRRYATVLSLMKAQAAKFSVDRVAELTWMEPAKVSEFNTLFMHAPKLAYHAWTGVGQHTNATQTERAIATLYALTGACDRDGGICGRARRRIGWSTTTKACCRRGSKTRPSGLTNCRWVRPALAGSPLVISAARCSRIARIRCAHSSVSEPICW